LPSWRGQTASSDDGLALAGRRDGEVRRSSSGGKRM
jgi:hypothetical protein